MQVSEFSLTLLRRDITSYIAWARFRSGAPSDDEEQTAQVVFQLDPVALSRGWTNHCEYGQALTAAVFRGDVLARWRVAQKHAPLRVRLEVQDSALDLHRIRWETLRVPDDPVDPAKSLLTSQTYWFSRHLPAGWEAPRSHGRTREFARSLVAIAGPSNLAGRTIFGREFGLDDVFKSDEEIVALRTLLSGLTKDVTILPDPEGRRATLKNIVERLREGAGYDVLYLVAHGGLDGTKPVLLLENGNGELEPTDARELVAAVGGLRYPPRLAVLSSCRSAGAARPYQPDTGPTELDAALGPQLGRAGIPAVVAMVGDVSQTTANQFVGKFFEQLVATGGQLDQSAAEARHEVAARPDYWSPVLYTRLTSGRLWRAPTGSRGKAPWLTGLRDLLASELVIPVLGSGLLEPVLGSIEAMAQQLIARKGESDPAAPPGLPRAAQYAATLLRRPMPHQFLIELAKQVRAVHPDLPNPLPAPDASDPEFGPSAPPGPSGPAARTAEARAAHDARRLLAAAAALVRKRSPPEPHDVLARLPCPVYISTNPDDLLGRALDKLGKKPVIQVCNWLSPVNNPPGSPADRQEANRDHPLVYHLFGHLSNPASLVLSEDDYFKFLVGISNEYAATRAQSRDAEKKWANFDAQLSVSGLLFLGFRLDDWDFRAFLNFFLNREAARNRSEAILDVAVQIDPTDGWHGGPEQVRQYLEKLFQRHKINIFWGTTEEFLEELEGA